MKKSTKVSPKTSPSNDFYKNIEAIIKEAEGLGMERIVLQKNPNIEIRKSDPAPVAIDNNGIISYDHCNVSTPIDKVINSPIFFMENSQEEQSRFIAFPTPLNSTISYYKDYVEVGKGIQGNKFKEPNRLFNKILINEFIKIIEANIGAVFYNGLYSFLKPFLTIDQDKTAELININIPNQYIYQIESNILSYKDHEDIMKSISTNCILTATLVGNIYFDFVNTIMIHGFINMREIVEYLAETQLIPFDKIDTKQYYMFVEGCLLELASEDVHKIIEIAEANAVQLKARYEGTDYNYPYDEDDE